MAQRDHTEVKGVLSGARETARYGAYRFIEILSFD
jgi:hypothetical protein